MALVGQCHQVLKLLLHGALGRISSNTLTKFVECNNVFVVSQQSNSYGCFVWKLLFLVGLQKIPNY
jgi:hypothetical protein